MVHELRKSLLRFAYLCVATPVILVFMTDVTQILSQIEQGDPNAAELLLPLVYDELRKMAAVKLANENPGQTLQATALVHEAYLRLVDVEQAQNWDSRRHFFSAAAESMRLFWLRKRGKNGGSNVAVRCAVYLWMMLK